jgi:hypothetical protein
MYMIYLDMDSAVYFALLKMPDYIADHINHTNSNIVPKATRLKTCAICQKSIDQRNAKSRENVSSAVSMSPCNHLFHKSCILTQLDSDHDERTRCAECHVYLCRLVVLSPEKAAEKGKDLVNDSDRSDNLFSES